MDFIFGNWIRGRCAIAVFLLRAVVGYAFILHGWPKIQNPMAWMGPQSDMPGYLQALAAVSEFGGGIALIIGLLMPLACLGLACTMWVAAVNVHMAQGHPFVGKGGPSYELAGIYFAIMIVLILTGPGTLSLDYQIFKRK